MVDRPPRVFISYSHASDDHADRVLALADRLRVEGIDITLDQYEISPPEGWPSWMERQVRESDFVLVVCTETYLRRAQRQEEPGIGHGVIFESTLSLQHLYEAGMRNTRFIPVVFEDRDTPHIPVPLRAASWYNVGTKSGYEKLYRHLTGQAETPAPDLGPRRRLPRRERQWRSPPRVADPEPPHLRPPQAADAFLRALHAGSALGGDASLRADQVNSLGTSLGMIPRDVLTLVERLQEDELVKVHWGGRVLDTHGQATC